MSSRTKLLTIGAVAGALLLPAVAQADSVVYVDGGNIWSAKPDGSAKVQLTDGGDWHSPTQADDGTIAASKGQDDLIRVLARDGRPIRTIETTFQKTGNGDTFAPRPLMMSFSPDGSKIAYSYAQYSCVPGSTCGSTEIATYVTDANVTTATPISTYGSSTGIANPEWVSPTRLVVAGRAGTGIALPELGFSYETRNPWIPGSIDLGDPELTRDGKRLALTTDYGPNLRIAFTKTKDDPRTEKHPATPDVICTTTADAKLSDPTWSPDGNAAAYVDSKGIETVFFGPGYADGKCDVTSESSISPTGSEPDWGPADPPAARYSAAPATTPGTPAAPTVPAAPAKPPVIPAPAPTSSALLAGGAARQKASALSVTCSAPKGVTCSAVASVKVKGRTIRSATAKAAGTGSSATLKPRFSKKALKTMRASLRKGVKATVVISAPGLGRATKTVTLTK